MMKIDKAPVPVIVPNPGDPRLTERVAGTDQTGAVVEINVPVERPLTLYLNAQEIVTMMTIGDYPEYLALGYLLNQNMLKYDDVVTEVEYDDDLQVVVVRTEHHTNFEAKLKKRTQTSGCAQGTAFGDLLEAVENVALPKAELRTSWLYQMTHAINTMPSLYLEAGAIHGCVLCKEGTPVCYTEDVGRHNAVDKIAGWIYRHGVDPADKILYTTGRLTSEMIIKTVRMGIPILVSRSGFTAWGVDLARQVGLTLVGRARGKRFIALSGQERIVYDQNLASESRSAQEVSSAFRNALSAGHEGIVAKLANSPYTPGRRGGLWFKLKEPFAMLDVVVTAVEYGHGKRYKVLSDFTFAVRDGETLLNIGKAYSGLTDAEILEYTQYFLQHTIEDQGYRRIVEPAVVLEVAFNNIQKSARHESGYALRFPRIVRIRTDKRVTEIDTLETAAKLFARQTAHRTSQTALT